MFGSGIENIVSYYLPLGGLWKVVMLSHACRELKIHYHRHNRVAINWPKLIICSNNWIKWYNIILLSHAGREWKIHYHRHNRVAVNWPALAICWNNWIRWYNIALWSHAYREPYLRMSWSWQFSIASSQGQWKFPTSIPWQKKNNTYYENVSIIDESLVRGRKKIPRVYQIIKRRLSLGSTCESYWKSREPMATGKSFWTKNA